MKKLFLFCIMLMPFSVFALDSEQATKPSFECSMLDTVESALVAKGETQSVFRVVANQTNTFLVICDNQEIIDNVTLVDYSYFEVGWETKHNYMKYDL